MYLPFLRGKLYELKAIKEYIEDGYGNEYGRHIMPIIEPVKKDRRPLMSCIEAMGNVGMPFAIVLNSRTGDYEKALFDVPSFVQEEKIQGVQWTPAFEVNGNANVDAVETVISENGFEDVMLIFFTIVDLDDEKIKRIVNNGAVKYIAALNMIQRPAILDELTDAGKSVITIEDCFQEKSPNNAYRDNLDESALGRNYRDRGALPQVVAIHMTYRKSERVINVHHFLSDSRNGANDIRNEFKEANDKIPPFYVNKPTTKAIDQISGKEYPGLGAIKKYSIKNHFELIERVLHEREDK